MCMYICDHYHFLLEKKRVKWNKHFSVFSKQFSTNNQNVRILYLF